MRTPIRCGAAAGSGSFTTVSAIGSRGHIAVPKGQHGRGVLALLSTTIDNVGLSSSFTYTPRAPLSLLAISWHLGGYSSVKRNRGLRCSPFTHKSYGVFWVLGAAPTRYGQPASPCVTIMLGGWSASHVYRGGTCTVGPTCGIGRWWATVLITMIATVSNYCMNTILEVLNVSCA